MNSLHTGCMRCGTCCKKGGPSFHLEDRHLIENGIILLKHLYTIRAGETALDNIRGELSPVKSDIIKIKGQQGLWTCIFFEETSVSCTIYEHRPVECRMLDCRNTSKLQRIYDQNRLTRKDLISGIKGMWELVEDHHARCSYQQMDRYLKKYADGTDKNHAEKKILDMIHYDTQIRTQVVTRGGLDPEITDFLFGRPMTAHVRAMSRHWSVSFPFIS